MILQTRPATNYLSPGPLRSWARVAALSLLAALAACSREQPQGAEPLCGGDFGVGMRVEGQATPLEVCVSDADVSALLTSLGRYDISAPMQTDAGIYQLQMVFAERFDFPVSLRIVDSLAVALSDPGAVWLYYEEIPKNGKTIESAAVSGGHFRLSFSDDKVVVGFFENVELTMQEVLTGDPAGKRRIVRGEFSISVDPPVAGVVAHAGIPRGGSLPVARRDVGRPEVPLAARSP